MLRILTLGGLTLTRSDEAIAATELRLQGMGLLARLAVAGERGVSREKLVGCFWPDKEERAAHHSLSQALHRLRHDLGVEPLILGTRVLRLNPALVWSDVGAFHDALHSRDAKRMVELRAGPFLDGIFFHGLPDLERWIESERARIEELYASALRTLAIAAGAAREHDAAARWWRKLLELDPLDGRIALEVVRALHSAGDAGGALREARHHRALVRAELRTEADPRILEIIERGARAMHAAALDLYDAEAHLHLAWHYILEGRETRDSRLRMRALHHCRIAAELDPTLADVPVALECLARLEAPPDANGGATAVTPPSLVSRRSVEAYAAPGTNPSAAPRPG
ncbi:MAG TPA: BTAD domain-containing putative transcriptional regulator [Gemmatimonadaceae bacterium]|nr:BTAD domain-containing putative transcriptional regulator [Gemmatimonadaceae bacterium]